jgi:hypothetical protein
MAIDQRDISSSLRFMKDDVLRQYAAMHKNDPYIFPLAFQESQNRQKLRMSQQAQMAQQPQPKVSDQALAQMAPQQPRPMAQPMPEAQGIGALPAGNMEGMADGGIVGYEGYDETPRQFSQEPVMMMAEGGVARYQVGGDTMGGFSGMSPEQEAALEIRAENEQKLRQISDLEKQVTFLTSVGAPQAQQARAQLDALKSTMGPKPSPTDPSFRRQQDPRTTPGVAATSPARPLITSDAAPKVDTGRKAPAAAADPASAGLAGIKDPAKLYQDILAKQEYKDPAADALLELEARERANAAAERQAIATDAERFKDAFKGREGRLAEREADIGKQKGQNTGLALLNAGLAIMSTPGGLATAIGKGAQVGTAQFASGLDKIRSAQERLGEARDRLDDLKLNREETTAKELRAAERNYREVAVNTQKRTIDGIRTAAGVNETRAKNIYDKTIDVQKTIYEQGEQTKRTRMQVDASNRNNQLDLVQALQADPKLMATYRAMQGKNEDVMGQYNDFLKANPTLAMDPKAAFTQFLMTKSAFQQLGTPTVTDKPTGPVRN